ncbi:molybdenum ABC transporter ATP-binding protein [Desulfobacter vibrioformis]|uniref:molybdenum ABC transporter ATP-binding protein n=1 Tax=Desulfobacter vibrioformis TaxID=34031 RepID=UPI00068DFCB6|nr:molybdenum ABC transporter ATP-binding protein [Desulfobacter vibrioformis]
MFEVKLKKKQGDFLVDTAFSTHTTGITALFGRSGAGKTSVINMIAGLSRPDTGLIRIHDTILFDSEKRINLRPYKRRVGYVFQEGRLFPHFSVKSNLTYGMKRIKGARRYIDFNKVVDLLGIGHLLDRRPATLSGGEKQRVAIGRALLASPRLLLMDEPLASLDAARKAEVLPFINKLPGQFDIPILYVSHSVDEIRSLADNLVFLVDGSTRASGPVETVAIRKDFKAVVGRQEHLPFTVLSSN